MKIASRLLGNAITRATSPFSSITRVASDVYSMKSDESPLYASSPAIALA